MIAWVQRLISHTENTASSVFSTCQPDVLAGFTVKNTSDKELEQAESRINGKQRNALPSCQLFPVQGGHR